VSPVKLTKPNASSLKAARSNSMAYQGTGVCLVDPKTEQKKPSPVGQSACTPSCREGRCGAREPLRGRSQRRMRAWKVRVPKGKTEQRNTPQRKEQSRGGGRVVRRNKNTVLYCTHRGAYGSLRSVTERDPCTVLYVTRSPRRVLDFWDEPKSCCLPESLSGPVQCLMRAR
jgi:hypothetical protein